MKSFTTRRGCAWLIGLTATLFVPIDALAQTKDQARTALSSGMDATRLAEAIDNRPTNQGRTGEMHFTLRNARGKERSRTAVLQHADLNEMTKLASHFTAPAAIRDTGFLNHNADSGTDQSWLYLPSTDRVRRLPSSDRGDYFMGTDLTYGDLQDNFKFPLEDWQFSGGEPAEVAGKKMLRLAGTATEAASLALGYRSFTALVDPETLFPKELTYTDRDGEPLKQLQVLHQEQIDGAWTAMKFSVTNLQTGHSTVIELRNVRADNNMDLSRLEADALDLGAPDLG